MSRKSKDKKKKHKQKVAPTAPTPAPPSPPPPPQPLVPQPIAANPSKYGLFLTVLGLVLTAIALVELFPRLSATANSPTDADDQLGSSKFTVSNDGYLRVTDVKAACYLRKVLYKAGPTPAEVANVLMQIIVPPDSTLRPTDGLTAPCTFRRLIGTDPPYRQFMIVRADLAIVVYYRAWPFTFYRDHRLFRFVANVEADGTLLWEKQPAAELERDYDRFSQNGRLFK